jgi:hypothetical protein
LRWPISNRTTRRDHAVRSTDHQLELVMAAAALLDPSKRVTLMERIAANLRRTGLRYPIDHDVNHAIKVAMAGLLRGSAA